MSVQRPRQVSFILLPGFALSSFSLAIEALSVANQLRQTPLYEYRILGLHPQVERCQIISSNQVPVETSGDIAQCTEADLVFICAHSGAAEFQDARLRNKLRQLANSGCKLAALSCGAFMLAEAGLLNGHSCTLVNNYRTAFAELYPNIALQENLYTVTGSIFTSAGGTATLDLLWYLIAIDQGKAFAHAVAEQFLQDRVRSNEEMQRSLQVIQLRMLSPALGAAIELMEQHIESPYSIEFLANQIGASRRNLEKVFQRHTAMTPSQYYLQLRLTKARELLEQTSLSLSQIAQASGFSSQSHFGHNFKRYYGMSPAKARN